MIFFISAVVLVFVLALIRIPKKQPLLQSPQAELPKQQDPPKPTAPTAPTAPATEQFVSQQTFAVLAVKGIAALEQLPETFASTEIDFTLRSDGPDRQYQCLNSPNFQVKSRDEAVSRFLAFMKLNRNNDGVGYKHTLTIEVGGNIPPTIYMKKTIEQPSVIQPKEAAVENVATEAPIGTGALANLPNKTLGSEDMNF